MKDARKLIEENLRHAAESKKRDRAILESLAPVRWVPIYAPLLPAARRLWGRWWFWGSA